MDEQQEKIEETTPEVEDTPVYIPRPAWQIWHARLGLVLFVGLIILHYINMARGN